MKQQQFYVLIARPGRYPISFIELHTGNSLLEVADELAKSVSVMQNGAIVLSIIDARMFPMGIDVYEFFHQKRKELDKDVLAYSKKWYKEHKKQKDHVMS